jgi:pimeloyl-ACP methyl ester carboxylesterase
MVDDAVELIEHLQDRLGIEKVILVGHSWGSMLGIGVAKQRPDLLHAYVGVGQVVHWQENFNESKRLMLAAAEEAGHAETAEALRAVSDTWPPKGDDEALDEYLESIQKYLGDYGASIWALKDPTDFTGSEMILDAIFSPDSTIPDAMAFFGGGDASPATYALMHDLYDWDRISDPDDYVFDTPIIIFQGEHDWQTPTPLAKPWFARIEAPYKEYIAFENSAHFVIPEEPGKYIFSLVDRVRPLAVEQPVETSEEMKSAA